MLAALGISLIQTFIPRDILTSDLATFIPPHFSPPYGVRSGDGCNKGDSCQTVQQVSCAMFTFMVITLI